MVEELLTKVRALVAREGLGGPEPARGEVAPGAINKDQPPSVSTKGEDLRRAEERHDS